MPRTTLLDAKNEGLPSAIGACSDSARFLLRLNTACRRLLKRGKYFGTFGRYRMCVTSGCLTLPPQIATIESIAVCGRPIRLHDQWFEFLENGLGPTQCTSTNGEGSCFAGGLGCAGDAKYRGRYPTFADVTGLDKKLLLICDLVADVGVEVLVLGYDENNNWIRTTQNGVMADGEIITLAQSPGTVSTHIFKVITDIQFNQAHDGQCWLYSLAPPYDAATSDKVMLGNYQYFETRPSYARYYIGGMLTGSDGEGSCNLTTVDVMAKHDFIPVVKDNDYLVIGNLDALEFMIQALEKYRNAVSQTQVAEAMAFEKLAENELEKELDHYRGSGVVTGITVSGSDIGRADPVPNYI